MPASARGMGTLARRIIALLKQHPDGLWALTIARTLHASHAKVGTQLQAMERIGYICLQTTIDNGPCYVATTAGVRMLEIEATQEYHRVLRDEGVI